MALNSEQVGKLLKLIQQTHESEMSCQACLDELDKYTQRILDGEAIDGVLGAVRRHLDACPCCKGQFQLVLDTLDAIDES